MEFKLTFNCNNAAFDDMPEIEISRILREVASFAENHGLPRRIHDHNGNMIGLAELIEE